MDSTTTPPTPAARPARLPGASDDPAARLPATGARPAFRTTGTFVGTAATNGSLAGLRGARARVRASGTHRPRRRAPGTTRPAPRPARPWRVAIAVLLPLGPLFVAVAFALRPFTGSEEPAVIIERILASPRTDLLLWLGFLAPGLLLLATVAAGHLARRGAPVLATIATTINALAFGLMSGAVASGDLITVAGGRAGVDPATILTITDAIENSPITSTALGIWVPGHILGMVLLAVALRRARVLPLWAAVVLGISQPIHFLAFVVLQNQYVDAVAGWGFTAVGFTAVAVALLRTRDDDWDLPPSSR